MLADPHEKKMISHKNPYEYEQAQNYLKQMEIESMNIMDTGSSVEGDIVRQRITKHKQEFDKVRKEIRKRQQAYDRDMISSSRSTGEQVSAFW